MKTEMQSLTAALTEWVDVQASVGEVTILVRDFTCYGDPQGLIVKINDKEPTGINNAYRSTLQIERDLVKVVPGYIKGALIWQEQDKEE